MDLIIERVPVTDSTEYIDTQVEEVVLYLYSDSVKLFTRMDTLLLVKMKLSFKDAVYMDKYKQRWQFLYERMTNGEFMFRFTPLLPHRRNKLYAINLWNI